MLDPDNNKNYRPVSNFSFISKVLEKVVAKHLTTYLQQNRLQEPFQSDKQAHSTKTALLRVQNDIARAPGEQKVIFLVLLDLSAAFDTVNHCCLLSILEKLGVTGTARNWFSSYLQSRYQTTSIRGTLSSPGKLTCWVPQGPVLGPVLLPICTSSLGRLLRHYLPN